MTREEAITELSVLWERNGEPTDGRYREALDMAIKAIEQTNALDKARAEIAEYGSIWVEYIIPGHTDHDIEVIESACDIVREDLESKGIQIDGFAPMGWFKYDGEDE